jgi:hypothetical protein
MYNRRMKAMQQAAQIDCDRLRYYAMFFACAVMPSSSASFGDFHCIHRFGLLKNPTN